jgi:hypothetical protein
MSGTQWVQIELELCDLCSKRARWKHPEGGLRCSTCPRPEAEPDKNCVTTPDGSCVGEACMHDVHKVHIGDVLVHLGEPPDGNPYHGQSLMGDERVTALYLFKHKQMKKATKFYTLWYAPASGGARRITAEEVDWESSGVK